MRQFYLLSVYCLLISSIQAQTLTSNRNHIRSGDIIIKQQVEFKDPGASGKEIFWDFSNASIINDKYQLIYHNITKGDTVNIMGFEHDTSVLTDKQTLIK